MSDAVSVPEPRRAEQEIAIRDLRNAGRVVAELAAAGAIGKVTSGGRLVGWLVPATPAEHRGRRRLPRRTDVPTLGETLEQMRSEERT